MSNVLIGIIGVILFIGLALAGALFLGPRFQEATSSSKASALAAVLQQTAAATNMYHLDTGAPIPSSVAGSLGSVLTASKYLKAASANPVNNGTIAAVNSGGSHDASAATFIYTDIGKGEAARSVCRSIERNAGNPNPDQTLDAERDFSDVVMANHRIGCFMNYVGSYQAYIPV